MTGDLTDRRGSGHSSGVVVLANRRVSHERVSSDDARFLAIYDGVAPMTMRVLRRLGVPDELLDDALQEVFIVVHRRLAEFEDRSSVKTWVTGITVRVAQALRRKERRRLARVSPTEDVDAFLAEGASPHDVAARREAMAVVGAFLDALDEDKRTVFVLRELEQMTVPEIAEATGTNLNTVYARSRAARRAFEEAVAAARKEPT